MTRQWLGYSEAKTPGSYFPVYEGGKWVARVICPNGHEAGVLRNHTIREDGMVMESCMCLACDWHEYVQLEDWALHRGS